MSVDGVPHVASTNDAEQATFGNEADFIGDSFLNVNQIGFHVFQTGENIGIRQSEYAVIKVEVDPNLAATPPLTNFSTVQFVPSQHDSQVWSGVYRRDHRSRECYGQRLVYVG